MIKWTAVAVLLAGVAGFGMVPPAVAAQSACTDLGGTVDASAQCHIDRADAGFRFHASFPVGYPDQQAVASYLTGERDRMADYAATFPPTGRESGYELTITGKPYQSAGTESVVFAPRTIRARPTRAVRPPRTPRSATTWAAALRSRSRHCSSRARRRPTCTPRRRICRRRTTSVCTATATSRSPTTRW